MRCRGSLRAARLSSVGLLVAATVGAGLIGVVADPAIPQASAQDAGLLTRAAERAANDVTALEKDLAEAKAADLRERQKAAEVEADLVTRRDAAKAQAVELTAKEKKLTAKLDDLHVKSDQLKVKLRSSKADLEMRQAVITKWAVAAFVNTGNEQAAIAMRPGDIEMRRRSALREQGGGALISRRDEATKELDDLKAEDVATTKGIEDTEAERERTKKAFEAATLEEAALEEERLVSLDDEYQRQDRNKQLQYDLTTKLLQAEAMVTKFTQLNLDASTAINGQPVLDEVDLNRWYESTGRSARLTVPMSELTRLFVSEGRAENIRADIAFAQSILETGSFSFPSFGQLQPTDNNYAGIGACDSCANGFGFPDAQSGVRAQMQLLKIYANPTLTSADFANPSVRWTPEKLGVRGCCDTWSDLAGVWATGAAYFGQIDSVYSGIVNWVAEDYIKNGPPGAAALPTASAGTTSLDQSAPVTTAAPGSEIDGGGD